MLQFLLDFVFPRRSLTGSEGEWITDEERKRLRLYPIRLPKELLRQRDIKALDCLIAAGSYQASPLLRKAIRTFKYGRIAALGPELGQKIVSCLPGLLILPKEPVVVCPVPLHWTRKFQRGFNQAQILADTVGTARNYPVQELLKRTRATGHQAHRARADRLTALTNAFTYCGQSPAPRCVLLIDDISTTGATLDACALALKKAGTKHVVGLVVAYG